MNKVIVWGAILILLILPGACTKPAPVYVPALPQTESAAHITDSGSSSTAELEAKIRQLEAENQRLLNDIPNLLIMIEQVQNDADQLTSFLRGLPPLPPPPPGLDISNINNAVFKAVDIREKLLKLPPPPPLAPPIWTELDELKDYIIDMTEWMENLKELPDFLNIAGDLEELRAQEISHLENISGIMTDIKSVLERIRSANE